LRENVELVPLEWISDAGTNPTIRAFAVPRADRHVGNVILIASISYRIARLSIYIGELADREPGFRITATYRILEQACGPFALHKGVADGARNGTSLRRESTPNFASARSRYRRGSRRRWRHCPEG